MFYASKSIVQPPNLYEFRAREILYVFGQMRIICTASLARDVAIYQC